MNLLNASKEVGSLDKGFVYKLTLTISVNRYSCKTKGGGTIARLCLKQGKRKSFAHIRSGRDYTTGDGRLFCPYCSYEENSYV